MKYKFTFFKLYPVCVCGFSLFTTDNTPQNPTTLLSFALSLLLLPFHYIPLPRERVMLIEFMLFSVCLFTRVHTHALSQNCRAYLCMLCLRKPVRCIYCYTGFCFFYSYIAYPPLSKQTHTHRVSSVSLSPNDDLFFIYTPFSKKTTTFSHFVFSYFLVCFLSSLIVFFRFCYYCKQ